MIISATRPRHLRIQASIATRHDVTSPRALVLMLHGGTGRSQAAVDERSLSRRRSQTMLRAIAPGFAEDGVATWLMSYRVRGWNGGDGPVADARAALDEVRRELGDLPVCLLGHSMGARTAIHVADDPSVVGVVGLAPWWPTGEPIEALRGRHLLGAHGDRDRITSARQSRLFVERAASVTTSARLHGMGPVGHYLLRRVEAWNYLAAEAAVAMLHPTRH